MGLTTYRIYLDSRQNRVTAKALGGSSDKFDPSIDPSSSLPSCPRAARTSAATRASTAEQASSRMLTSGGEVLDNVDTHSKGEHVIIRQQKVCPLLAMRVERRAGQMSIFTRRAWTSLVIEGTWRFVTLQAISSDKGRNR